ncbi:hypothetical protein LX64_01905 [Chitinophaga skermanii]|uniref:DUF3108 domain-containing protein n=1 Tax=Chitinophaga skermanii TaxID=331697 RepID=A0A327QS46_9BACT|nr:hypothetical protein [Chitinophaga skermanii]RAJ06778.1 hypothetical protein LX64_01905 [Chitinophaga skermanii]
MKPFSRLAVACAMMLCSAQLSAQVDTIRVGQLLPQYLKPGNTKYLVYMEDSTSGAKIGASIWERTTNIEEVNGKKAFVVKQHWYNIDTMNSQRIIVSYCDAKTFLPIYHEAISQNKKGVGRTEKFEFTPGKIAAPNDEKLTNKGFTLNTSEPTFNWELDMETFVQLPLKVGKTFAVNFYHPGSPQKPQFYLYNVPAEETLTSTQGTKLRCWKLTTAMPQMKYTCTWWIDQKTRTVVKMEEAFSGKYRYKLLMSI